MTLYVSAEHLIETTGKKRPSAQVRALRGMGIEHKVRPDGKVLVSLEHLNKLLDGNVENRVKNRTEPKWELMK